MLWHKPCIGPGMELRRFGWVLMIAAPPICTKY